MSPTTWRRRSARSGRPACRSRWRLASSTACSAVALAAVGCGAEEPRIEAGAGAELAAHAADVRERVEQGDAIGAQAEAEELQALVANAIAAGDVPPELAEELRAGARRLTRLAAAAVPPPAEPPPPPPPPPPAEDEEDEGVDEGKGKAKGKDKKDGDGEDDD